MLLARKIIRSPGRYTTARRISMTYDWKRRPEKDIIEDVFLELQRNEIGKAFFNIGFVKYQLPCVTGLEAYGVPMNQYVDRYNIEVLPDYSISHVQISQLEMKASKMHPSPYVS